MEMILLKTKKTVLLTCFILVIPLLIGMYYQFAHSPTPYEQSFDESESDLITIGQAREIAITYLEDGEIQTIEWISDTPSRYRVFMTHEGYSYGFYIDGRSGEVSFFEPAMTMLESFPTIHIQTFGHVEPFYERNLWIDSIFTLEDFDPLANSIPTPGRIRGRGTSTWNMMPDKRPLRLQFERAQPFFGEESAANDWILLADHSDMSLLRNYSALHLSGQLDSLAWTPSARSIHLYVNDEYMGVYLLTEERTLAHQHMELSSHTDPTISEYFFEMEWRADRDDGVEGVDFIRVNSHPDGILGDSSAEAGFNRDYLYEIIYPYDDLLAEEHFDYLQTFMTEVGVLIRERDFEAISQRVDLDSLIDFYLVQELYMNLDVGFSSVFLQIRGEGENRRLYHGPVWDFDLAVGNAYWISTEGQTPFGGLYVAERHYWYWYLMHTPEFVELLADRWNNIVRDEALLMISHIERLASLRQEDFERNFQRHDILGASRWPNPEHISDIQTFDGQVDFLTEFLTDRVHYLDDIFNGERPMWR